MTSGESVPWGWVSLEVVLAVHSRQIAEHGGADGIRELGLIESALARPGNRMSLGNPDAAWLAAAYAHGLVPGHGFVGGNKRVAWVTARLFLLANGWQLVFDPCDAIRIMESASAGQVSEEAIANWFRLRLAARGHEFDSLAHPLTAPAHASHAWPRCADSVRQRLRCAGSAAHRAAGPPPRKCCSASGRCARALRTLPSPGLP